jgi:hypothetical protein
MERVFSRRWYYALVTAPRGYGRKGSINANQMAAISALEPEIVKQMREILVAAKDRAERGELIVLKPQSKMRAGSARRSE